MSERMNKERARELIKDFTNQIKVIDINDKTPEEIEIEKALDIAIESINELSEIKEKLFKHQTAQLIEKYGENGSIVPMTATNPKQDEWVDVNDRLPSESGEYVVTLKGEKDVATTVYSVRQKGWFHFSDEDIIAWKPLPQPYERT